MNQAKIGLEYPGSGEERSVWAKLLRIEYVPPLASAARAGEVVKKMGELGNGTMLIMREPGVKESLPKNGLH